MNLLPYLEDLEKRIDSQIARALAAGRPLRGLVHTDFIPGTRSDEALIRP